MLKEYKLHATTRQDIGKGASRRLRHGDKIPAIVYGAQKEPQSIVIEHREFMHSLEDESFYTSILTLEIDGKEEKVVLKDLQRHPFKPRLTHADFYRINESEKLTMLIPVHFVGEDVAVGVKIGGGIVFRLMNEVTVRCLPKDLPENITVDISKLELDETLHLSDLIASEGVEFLDLTHGENKPVVTITIPEDKSTSSNANETTSA